MKKPPEIMPPFPEKGNERGNGIEERSCRLLINEGKPVQEEIRKVVRSGERKRLDERCVWSRKGGETTEGGRRFAPTST